MSGDRHAFMTTLADVVRRDQTRRERRKKLGKAVKATISWLFTAAGLWALRAWMFMLAVGVIHAEWLPGVPTLGYWWAGLIIWLLRAGLTPSAPTRKADKKAGTT